MPQQRMDIRMIKDILRLKYQGGLSHERIARSLSISKGVVAKYLGLASAAGLDWQATADLDEASLERRLLGRTGLRRRDGRIELHVRLRHGRPEHAVVAGRARACAGLLRRLPATHRARQPTRARLGGLPLRAQAQRDGA